MVVLSELSEGSSSSSSTHSHKYDVFLSFRGLDTRLGFIAYLYRALLDANIITFLDDEEIETGEDLKPELKSAIKASRASVIVLSKNYATSTWCLDELVKILKQCRTTNHIVIPIFYHVEPTHVRKQESSFGDAMAKHRQTMDAETDAYKKSKWAKKMNRWTNALIEIANLKGKDVHGRREPEFIEEIVKDIYSRLGISSRTPLPQLFGVDYSIKFVTSWLKDASSYTTQVLTLSGMGGIGKTSLARYVFGLHFHEFDRSSFIEDVNRRCNETSKGLFDVQKQLCDDILKPSSVQVRDASKFISMIENIVTRKKVFLILDNIGSVDQLDALLGGKGFHPGSKIIITTRDKWLTKSCELFKTNVKPKHEDYELQILHETESRKLLCYHAFVSNHPKAGYEEVSEKVVEYCKGHPMALKVLGRSLHNRDVAYWEGCVDRLKKDNGSPINNVLKMSFDSLPSKDDKDLFKHIAFFFVGNGRDVVETILEACDVETKTGITHLIDRCLLSVGWNNELMMHQLVQEMGRSVVCEESPDRPWERSRLCGHDSFRVLQQKKATENVIGLSVDMKMFEKEKLCGSFELETEALSKMDSLMLLQLNYVQISGSYEKFPEELRWLCMHGFPLKAIPSDLPMENLVALDMSYSNIESFDICYGYPHKLYSRLKHLIGSHSKDKRFLGSLKILNLSFCEQLRSLGGFDQLSALERLIVTHCSGLVEVCDSIEQCVELVHIDLSYCSKLEKFPRNLGMLKKVKTLLLDGCNFGKSRIEIMDSDSQEKLKANNIDINMKASSSAILGAISMGSKLSVISLPRSLVSLSLVDSNLSTESFPMDLSCLSMLKELCLNGNPIVSMPNCVRSLPRLERLDMNFCEMLTSVEHPPHTLRELFFVCVRSDRPLLRKVVFDREMSPLHFSMHWEMFPPSSFEFEGMIKIQPIGGVEEKVLRSLGWTDLHFLKEKRLGTDNINRGREESEIQMYYEFGIFSTIYGGQEMPNWITDRSNVPSISFTIPSSPKQLRGLNFCFVLMALDDDFYCLPMIMIRNTTKNYTWSYQHFIESVGVNGSFMIFLSHWMFGMNEMEAGDHVTITINGHHPLTMAWAGRSYNIANLFIMECGVSLVYEDGNTNEEEEDALGYYKSWNHIIGKDLSAFQTTTGQYILDMWRFRPILCETLPSLRHLCGEGVRFKEPLQFRALSQRKSGVCLPEDSPINKRTFTSLSRVYMLSSNKYLSSSRKG